MVDVTNRSDVYMRLTAIKFFLCHCFSSNLFMEYQTPWCSVISINLLESLPKLRIDLFDPFQVNLTNQRLVRYRQYAVILLCRGTELRQTGIYFLENSLLQDL